MPSAAGTRAIEALKADFDRLHEAGIAAAAVSIDSEQVQAAYAAKLELPFLLLSDERRSAVELLGIETVADGENVNVATSDRARRRPRRGRAGRDRSGGPRGSRRSGRALPVGAAAGLTAMLAARLHAPGEELRLERRPPAGAVRDRRCACVCWHVASAAPISISSTAPSRGSTCHGPSGTRLRA